MAEYCDRFKFSETNQDHYEMVPNDNDTYQFWQGLRGPVFIPYVNVDTGYMSWTNNGGLPNPEPVKIVGKDGRGIQLKGYANSVADLPEEAEEGDCWAVGEEDPLEAYAWFDGWCDLGVMFPAGQDGVSPTVTMTAITGGTRLTITDIDHPGGQSTDIMNGSPGNPGQDGVSPAVTMTAITGGTRITITDVDHPSGQSADIMNGTDGTDGTDGVSPEVTMTAITGGTRITITDVDHPSGQSADIMNGTDGAPGPGVPSGGTAGQFLKKASSTDYDGTWASLGSDDVGYDGSQNYAAGTAGKQIKDLGAELTLAENSVTSYVVGNTNTTGVNLDPGTFVWVKNHSTLSDGLYTVKTTAIVSGGSVVDTNMEHVDAGGLNNLKNSIEYDSFTLTGTKLSGKRFGKIVTIMIAEGAITGTGGSLSLGTVPERFHPTSKTLRFLIDDNGVSTRADYYPLEISIDTNGSVKCYLWASKLTVNPIGAITFVI